MQLAADAVVLVEHQALPTPTCLHIEAFRHFVGLLHECWVINVYARLPAETLGHDVLSVTIVITELGVVRTAEGQPRFQFTLLLLILTAIDAFCQLSQSR